jgi:multiple sugar transport system permease protein
MPVSAMRADPTRAILPRVTPPRPVPRSRRRNRRGAGTGIALSLPVIVFFAVFWVLPFCNALYLSFTDYAMAGSPAWIGLANYRRLVHDPEFWHSVRVTLIFAICTVVPTVVLGLLIAVPLSRPGRLNRWLRSALLVPAVIPLVAGSVVWLVIYGDDGFANTLLGSVGLHHVSWLTDENVALWALIIMVIWKQLGLNVLIFTAGLQELPRSVYEAAAIDGAGPITTFFRVTLPLLRRAILFVLVIAIAAAMQSFIPAYLLTQGGPANATEVLPLYLYTNAFAFQRMGYASAIAMVLLVFMLALSAVQFRFLRGDER